MARKVQAFEASDGSLYRNKAQAAERDVACVIADILADEFGDPMQLIVVERLIKHRERVIGALTEYHRVAPIENKGKPPQKKPEGPGSEGTQDYKPSPIPEGHVARCACHRTEDFADCDCIGHVAKEPIPPLVYWSEAESNFYGSVSRRGQGKHFYDKWYPRRSEFPTTVHEDDI